MKKYYLLILPVLLLTLLPLSPSGGSFYNGISGALFCDSAGGCLHEIAHRMDDDLGYPSRSPEFGNAIMIHLAFALKYQMDDTAIIILSHDGLLNYSADYSWLGLEQFSSPQEELYARLYEMSGGDVAKLPPAFRGFYSVDTKYIQLYDCLMSADFKACGTALHKEK